MSTLSVSGTDTLYNVLTSLRAFGETEVLLEIPGDSLLFGNPLTLDIIKKTGQKIGKRVAFEGADKQACKILSAISNGRMEREELSRTRACRSRPNLLTPIRQVFGKLFHIVSMNTVLASLKSRSLLLLATVLLAGGALVAGVLIYLNNSVTAKVALHLSADELAESFQIKGKPDVKEEGEEEGEPILPLTVITVEGEKSHSIDATGEKTIGSKASGKVVVYNKTDHEKKFAKNTAVSLITTEDTVKFLMNYEITVPARSIATASAERVEYRSGSAEVEVVAEKIGEQGNIKAKQSFTIGNESTNDFVGENAADFGGGESRQVRVVTQKDLTNVLASARALLREEAIAEVRAKMVGDQRLEQGAIEVVVLSSVYDKQVGEEAEKVEVTLNLKLTAGVYSEEVLRSLLRGLLEQKVPDNYSLSDDKISFSIEEVTGSPEQQLFYTVKVRGFVVPKFDKTELARSLAGLSLNGASDHVRSLNGVTSSQVSISSRFSFLDRFLFSKKLPTDPEKIAIEVVSD